MAIVAAGMTALTMVVQGIQGYRQARADRLEGQYLERQAQTNARMANYQAEDAIARGDKEALSHKIMTNKFIGSQRAAMAAQGLDLEADDAAAIQEESKVAGAIDAQTIKNNAWKEAWGYRVQAEDFTQKGQFARITSKLKADNTILTSGLGILNTGLSYFKK
jgi:hypothetical protein